MTDPLLDTSHDGVGVSRDVSGTTPRPETGWQGGSQDAQPLSRAYVLGMLDMTNLSPRSRERIEATFDGWHARRKAVEVERDQLRVERSRLRTALIEVVQTSDLIGSVPTSVVGRCRDALTPAPEATT